jgi:type I restriction enzyme S subunit
MLSVDRALSYELDAIGIGRKGTIDKPYLLKAPFWTVDTLFFIIPDLQSDIDFMLGQFERIDWKAKDESTGVPSLSKDSISSTEICKPRLSEQKRIGRFLRRLNNLISLHQRELEVLQNAKQAFLTKMFV